MFLLRIERLAQWGRPSMDRLKHLNLRRCLTSFAAIEIETLARSIVSLALRPEGLSCPNFSSARLTVQRPEACRFIVY